MIVPDSHHKRTAEAMRQDSAEITPEQIEDARKLVAKYPNIAQPNRATTTAGGAIRFAKGVLIGIAAGYALTDLTFKIITLAAPWLR